ncbi:MAG: hypothetical protein JWQ14_1568, partial [Adhaeribacter sp.]|nr:hypothetical protein [Adhaeribacter sp.]
DDPRRSSGAELALLNSQGGAIGLLTTTRPVYATNNRLLNRQFFEAVFTPINGRMPRLGDLYRLTKNQSQAQANNRNFTLLGDPSQQLAYPALKAIITGINQAAVTTGITDTLNAAVPINLTGTVTNEQGNILTSFQGQVVVKIFAPPGTFKTLGDESAPGSGNIQTVQVRENILFNGLATVKNGQFTVSFRLPKDAGNLAGKGKISLYAFNATTDAHGGQANVAVGSAVNQPATDSTPPTIKLYLHDETFVSGGITGKNPEVLAKFYDASGINITTGQGHEIKGILDGDTTRTIILNEFYTAEPDNFKAGQVRYFLSDLTPGSHELKIKAWDVYNNAAEARLVFIVTGAETIRLEDILNYPNPFPDNTNFSFNHNRAGEDLDIQIQIFDLTGKLVKTIREKRLYSQNHIADLLWNGQDDRGHLLTNGVYLYKIKITSLTNGISTERFNKLMILK